MTNFQLSLRVKVALSICISLACLIAVACLVAKSAAHNLSGICDSESRVLSDDEFINVAIAYELDYEKKYALSPIKRYASVEQFRQINPRCCEIERKIEDDGFPPFSHAFGTYFAEVTVTYQIANNEDEDYHRATIWLDRCGSPAENFGYRVKRPKNAMDHG